jgi:hypothetical protein
MRKYLLFVLITISTYPSYGQTILFSQNFDSSSNLYDYFNINAPTIGQFNAFRSSLLIQDQIETELTIENGRLNFVKPTNAVYKSVNRGTNFIDTPKIIKVELDVEVSELTSASTISFSFDLGNNFPNNTAGSLTGTNVHSNFAISTSSNWPATEYRLRNIMASQTSDISLTGVTHITWIVNNATATHYYIAPDGTSKSVGVDKYDIWAGTQQIFDEAPCRYPNNAITNFRMTNVAGYHTVSVDNLVITAETFTPSPVPVTLLSFNTFENNGNVQLRWETASEINNDRFEIERSKDGRTYTSIEKVAARGIPSVYSVEDKNPSVGLNYYRLVQYDQDGRFTYHSIRAIQIQDTRTVISVSSNPVNSNFKVYVDHYTGKGFTVELTDVMGRKVFAQSTNVSYNCTDYIIPVNIETVKGACILKVTGDKIEWSKKIVIL